MEIFFLNRKFNGNEVSFEKLFNFIKKSFTSKNITVHELENPYENGLINLFKSIIFFRKSIKNTALVHITGQIHYAAIALKTNKIIITVHDLGLYRNLSFGRFIIFKLFWIYLPFRRAKKIVAISEKTRKEIIKIMPSVEKKIIVIPNCVTIDIADDFIKESNEMLKNVLIVGTRFNKNIIRSLSALIDLPIALTIIGEIDEIMLDILHSNNIVFSNMQNICEQELLKQYQIADILLFPSLYEGFGLPILEAQAQNVIVITSNISPMKEIAGDAAVLVDPDSIESINAGLKKVLNFTRDEKIEMLLRGKTNLQHYSLTEISSKYLEIYENL